MVVVALAAGAIALAGGGGDNNEAERSPPTTTSSEPKPLTAATVIGPTAPGTYTMSGTRTVKDSDETTALLVTEVNDAPVMVDGVAHQVVHGHGSVDRLDYSREQAFEPSGVYRVRRRPWVRCPGTGRRRGRPTSPCPSMSVPAGHTRARESDVDTVQLVVTVFGHATVTATEDVMVNGTRVVAFVIDRTETFKVTQLAESNSEGTLLHVQIDSSREWLSPEYGLLVKSHTDSDVTESDINTGAVDALRAYRRPHARQHLAVVT